MGQTDHSKAQKGEEPECTKGYMRVLAILQHRQRGFSNSICASLKRFAQALLELGANP
jgi:hypothetical protein